jgi:hypothetical protein
MNYYYYHYDIINQITLIIYNCDPIYKFIFNIFIFIEFNIFYINLIFYLKLFIK